MSTVALEDGALLHVEDSGVGQPLVLISGLGGTGGFWSALVSALGDKVRAVRFDQRGIASSTRGTQPVTIESLAQDTWAIVDALGIDEPILCGHSTGGAIVQRMVLQRPNIAHGLILSGSWAGPDWYVERMFRLRLELLETAPKRYLELAALLASPPRWLRDRPHILEKTLDQELGPEETAVVKERIQALLSHDCRDLLGEITVPCLVLGAEDDMIIPPYLQDELAQLLPNSSCHTFQSGGHFYPVTRPEDTAEQINRWMAELNNRSPYHGS